MISTAEGVRERYTRWLAEDSDIHDHLPLLESLAHGNVLEIGVRSGVSTSALLHGVLTKGGHLYSVDIESGCECVFQGHPQWSFICADSLKDYKRILHYIPPTLDLLLVDGDHDYRHCYNDLSTYGPRAKVIAVHDTDAPEWPEVRDAVADYFTTQGTHVFCQFYKGSNGMAVLERSGEIR